MASAGKRKLLPRGKPFPKGNKANPSGRSREVRKRQEDVAAYIRGKLAELRDDGRTNMDACVDASLAAGVLPDGLHDREFLFAYAFGRPLQRMESSVKADVRIKIKRNVRAPKCVAPDADDHV